MNEENERIMKFALEQQEREENRMNEKKKKEEVMSAVQQNVFLLIILNVFPITLINIPCLIQLNNFMHSRKPLLTLLLLCLGSGNLGRGGGG